MRPSNGSSSSSRPVKQSYREQSSTLPAPASAIVVVLFAQDQSRWTSESRHFGIGRPDQDFVYKPRLPAGDYYAVAFEQDDPAVSLNDPEILQQLRERATKVAVVEGEKQTLSLTVSVPPVY